MKFGPLTVRRAGMNPEQDPVGAMSTRDGVRIEINSSYERGGAILTVDKRLLIGLAPVGVALCSLATVGLGYITSFFK